MIVTFYKYIEYYHISWSIGNYDSILITTCKFYILIMFINDFSNSKTSWCISTHWRRFIYFLLKLNAFKKVFDCHVISTRNKAAVRYCSISNENLTHSNVHQLSIPSFFCQFFYGWHWYTLVKKLSIAQPLFQVFLRLLSPSFSPVICIFPTKELLPR